MLALRKGNIDYAFIVLVVGVLVSAWVTDRIGLELIFGAFLFGTFIPKTESKAMVAEVVHRIESVTLIILLPVFFVVAGLAVNIRAIGWGGLGALLLIIAAAIVGKFGGAAAAAKSFGLPTRQSLALGVLMNTRGLTELVILTVGLSLGVLVPQLFTLFVIMAVVTTLLTGPGFRLTYPDVILQAEIDRARRIALQGGAYSPLVVIGEAMVAARVAIALGCRLARAPGQVIAVRFLAKVSSANVYSGIAGDLIAVTGAMEEVKEVAGDAVEPIVQLTADWREDLAAVVNRNVADVAVVTRGDLVDILEAGIALPCDMLGIDPPEVPGFGGLAVLVGGGAEGDAAIEVGLRISLGGIAQDRQGEAIALNSSVALGDRTLPPGPAPRDGIDAGMRNSAARLARKPSRWHRGDGADRGDHATQRRRATGVGCALVRTRLARRCEQRPEPTLPPGTLPQARGLGGCARGWRP